MTQQIGIGGALRKARDRRGLTIDEAGRGIRLRPDYIAALEGEAFDTLPGDVYVRGFLRSYSRFLGLNPTKVVGAYERARGAGNADPAPVDRSPALAATDDPALPGTRRHFPWPLAGAMALIVLVVAAAGGFLSRSASTPEPVQPGSPAAVAVSPQGVHVDLIVTRDVDIRVSADGLPQLDRRLREGQAISFEAEREIELWLEYGKSVELKVNGRDVGKPGGLTREFSQTFTPTSFREERSR